jgi:acyl carrier protein
MTQHVLEAALRKLVSERLNLRVADVALDAPLGDALGFDSLTGLELMAEVEEAFAVRFTDEHLARPRTLANILAALDEVSWRKAS